jgi:hypothetical protein
MFCNLFGHRLKRNLASEETARDLILESVTFWYDFLASSPAAIKSKDSFYFAKQPSRNVLVCAGYQY